MKKILRLFICVFSFLTILSAYNSVFAYSAGGTPTWCIAESCPIVDGEQDCSCTKWAEGYWPSWETTNECPSWCCGIKLNTNFPIIWNCIWDDADEDATNAFPTMTKALAKIVVSLILVVCFILVIVAGIMWAADKPWSRTWWWAKWLIAKVAITILLLWFSWVILRLINPNFFG